MKYVVLTLCAVAVIALSAGTTFAVLAWAPDRLPQPVAAKHGIPGPVGPTGKPGPKGERGPRGQKAPTAVEEPSALVERLQNDVLNLEDWQKTECRRLAYNSGAPDGDERYLYTLQELAIERFEDLNCENL